jgi:hypothetical protein
MACFSPLVLVIRPGDGPKEILENQNTQTRYSVYELQASGIISILYADCRLLSVQFQRLCVLVLTLLRTFINFSRKVTTTTQRSVPTHIEIIYCVSANQFLGRLSS